MSSKLAGVTIAVLGGDDRELVLVPRLTAMGANVRVAGISKLVENPEVQSYKSLEEAVRGAEFIILPMPGVDDRGVVRAKYGTGELILNSETVRSFPEKAVVITGFARPMLKDLVSSRGLKLIEIAEMDEVAILNSIPSAEGALKMAMDATDCTIHGSKSVVIGFGRCGVTLARMLHALGARTFVVARKPADRARIWEMGMDPLGYEQFKNRVKEADIIFNTVPALVLDRSILEEANPAVYICDIASAPGGVDFEAAKALGIKAELAPGLPGKVAPRSAGMILAKVIPEIILSELSVTASSVLTGIDGGRGC